MYLRHTSPTPRQQGWHVSCPRLGALTRWRRLGPRLRQAWCHRERNRHVRPLHPACLGALRLREARALVPMLSGARSPSPPRRARFDPRIEARVRSGASRDMTQPCECTLRFAGARSHAPPSSCGRLSAHTARGDRVARRRRSSTTVSVRVAATGQRPSPTGVSNVTSTTEKPWWWPFELVLK